MNIIFHAPVSRPKHDPIGMLVLASTVCSVFALLIAFLTR